MELELRSSDARIAHIYGPRGAGRKALRDQDYASTFSEPCSLGHGSQEKAWVISGIVTGEIGEWRSGSLKDMGAPDACRKQWLA